jgi:hypothetical protein
MGVEWRAGALGRLALALIPFVLPSPGRAETFTDLLGSEVTRPIGQALAQQVGRSIPVPSASAGVTYEETDDPLMPGKRTVSLAGQLYLERPDTVGHRRWNVSLGYQRLRIDTVDGHDIRDLRDVRHPICGRFACRAPAFTLPRFSIDLAVDQVIGSVTYGLTPDVEVNLALPVLYSDFDFDVRAELVGGGGDQAHASSSKVGVGDLLTRIKWRFLARERFRAAAGLGLRIPTGEEENFQGTGDTELSPQLSLAGDVWRSKGIRLVSYLNGGLDVDVERVDESQARWGLGLDVHGGDDVTIAVAVLGRHPFARIAAPGFFDFFHCLGGCGQNPPARAARLPLLGLSGDRPDFYDFSVGARVNLWRHWLIGFANAIVPLNRDGFRADVVPFVGVEAVLGQPG